MLLELTSTLGSCVVVVEVVLNGFIVAGSERAILISKRVRMSTFLKSPGIATSSIQPRATFLLQCIPGSNSTLRKDHRLCGVRSVPPPANDEKFVSLLQREFRDGNTMKSTLDFTNCSCSSSSEEDSGTRRRAN
jgi:hypothetical protein